MSEDIAEYESPTIISIHSSLDHKNKYYLQVYLDNWPYKIVDKQMVDYLNGNHFGDWWRLVLSYCILLLR